MTSVHHAYKIATSKLLFVQMCLHTQTQHEFPPENCLAVTLQTLSHSLLRQQKTSPAELLHADGNPELWETARRGGVWGVGGGGCLVQLLLVTGCSLSGSRHGCHCGSVPCCCVCVREAFSSEPCDSEDV